MLTYLARFDETAVCLINEYLQRGKVACIITFIGNSGAYNTPLKNIRLWIGAVYIGLGLVKFASQFLDFLTYFPELRITA